MREQHLTKPQRVTRWALAGLLAGVPLVMAPGLSFYFDVTPKIVLLLAGVAAALCAVGGWLGGVRELARNRQGRWLLVLLAAQFVSLAVSTLFSSQPELSLTGSNWRRLGLITHSSLILFTLVTAGWMAGRLSNLAWLLRAAVLGGIAAALYGILQYSGIDPFLPAGQYHIGEGVWQIVRPPGTLGHAGYFATYLAHIVFLGLALSQIDRSRAWRLLGIGAAALGAVTIVFSGTRSAMLGLAVGVLLLVIWFRPRLTRRTVAVAALALVAGVAFYYSPAGLKMRARTRWYVEDPKGGARLWLWRDSARMGARYWATGAGLETFSSEFPRFQSAELARAFPNRYNESPHNVFLDAWTGQGLLGLAALAGLTLLALASARRTDGEQRWPGFILASLAAGLASNQFLAFTAPTALYFYFTVAMLVGMTAGWRREQASQPSSPKWAWGIGVVTALALVVFAVRLGWADWAMSQVRRRAEAGEVTEGVHLYHRLLRMKPDGMNTDLWFSRLMAATAENASDLRKRLLAWQTAKEAGERSVRFADALQNAHYNLAVLKATENDEEGTEQSLRSSISLAPNWYKPRWVLARLLARSGRMEEARRQAKLAFEMNGGVDAEVAQLWEQLAGARNRAGPADGSPELRHDSSKADKQ